MMHEAMDKMQAMKPKSEMTMQEHEDWINEHQKLMDQVMGQMMEEHHMLMNSAIPVYANDAHHPKADVQKSYAAKGEVVVVDKAAGKVKLKHEAIPELDWPAMTMFFAVADKSQLESLAVGDQAFNSVNHDEAGHAAMLVHRAWALGTLGVLVILAGWDVWHNKVDSSPAWWFAVAVIGAWSMTAITAWHGGELVYRHGLGVMSLPIAEAEHGHSHDAVMLDGDEHLHADGIPENQVHEHTHKVKEK
ncbi:conserved hypothetical protein [Ricinus communis]|uniref:DUF2231 domain-containing protein n=1 Tax=Ricinus communis TaxID=3988 RepID=B9TDJ2_RICCO|nr:conserved hypothetical protein [Ricinus communis]